MSQLFLFFHFDGFSFCDLLGGNPKMGTFSSAPKAAWGGKLFDPLRNKEKISNGV